MLKVVHVITDLDIGGAERMLVQTLPALAQRGVHQSVVCLSGEGVLAEVIRRQGHTVVCLNMRPGRPSLTAFIRLLRVIRKQSPDLIHSWLYHADFIASFAGLLSGKRTVWGLHNTTLSPQAKHSTRMIVRWLALMSYLFPRKIISCSQAAQDEHVRAGYAEKKFVYIPNGFDTERFKPDAGARRDLRDSFGLTENDLLIGNISRFDPQKDHRTLLRSWGVIAKENPRKSLHFLLAGKGMDSTNLTLNQWISEAGLTGKCRLLGIREDVPFLLNALDLFVLSSVGEAFPLALGEAMSAGVNCVTTDVGDAALLLGDCGQVVPAGDAEALTVAIQKWLAMPLSERNTQRMRGRQRILMHYALDKMADAYLAVYQSVLPGKRRQA